VRPSVLNEPLRSKHSSVGTPVLRPSMHAVRRIVQLGISLKSAMLFRFACVSAEASFTFKNCYGTPILPADWKREVLQGIFASIWQDGPQAQCLIDDSFHVPQLFHLLECWRLTWSNNVQNLGSCFGIDFWVCCQRVEGIAGILVSINRGSSSGNLRQGKCSSVSSTKNDCHQVATDFLSLRQFRRSPA
jgi:hypothetical protein